MKGKADHKAIPKKVLVMHNSIVRRNDIRDGYLSSLYSSAYYKQLIDEFV